MVQTHCITKIRIDAQEQIQHEQCRNETQYPSTDYTREDLNFSTPRSPHDVRVLLTVLY